MAVSGKATVKAVLSGDTVVLMGRSTGAAPPPEMQLTLSSLMAPRLARGPGTQDEPHAWESREFLRKLTIGKAVAFRVEYKVASIGRTFGAVKMDDGAGEASKTENLCLTVAREGWARLKPAEQSKEGSRSTDFEAMVEAAAAAEAAGKGVYSTTPGTIRAVKWNSNEYDSAELFQRCKGTPVKAVIEHVRDGASFRALLVDEMTTISFGLAGVVCPRMNMAPRQSAAPATAATATAPDGNGAAAGGAEGAANGEGGAEAAGAGATGRPSGASVIAAAAAASVSNQPKPEPCALQARFFTESRLLNREVDLLIQGVDSYGNFFGTVLHPKGNISVEILKGGLGRMQDWSSAFLSRDAASSMRSAENTAKHNTAGVWKGWKAPVIQGEQEYSGTVVEVHSGDQVSVLVQVREGAPKAERRVALSSLRTPKIGNARRGVPDEPWAAGAKESLRHKVIGREVKVCVDYERDLPQGDGPTVKRSFATVCTGKAGKEKNVAELLLQEGLGQVVRHRQDEPRSRDYDALMAAERAAQEAKKGRWSGKEAPVTRSMDLTGDPKRARSHLPFLQRQKSVKAIVEHVFAGHRFKLFIPKENCSLMFAVSAVRCPMPSRQGPGGQAAGGRPADPFGDEARLFSRAAIMQRSVEVEVEDMDKNGVALGVLHVNQKDYAEVLLKEGLATGDGRYLDRQGGKGLALKEVEAKAQASKLGVWSVQKDAEEQKAAREEQEDKNDQVAEELVGVKLSEICDGSRVFVNLTASDGLDVVEAKMKELKDKVGTTGAPMEYRRGSLCAALFDDGAGVKWFRARLGGMVGGGGGKGGGDAAAASKDKKGYSVSYIDYGNSAVVESKQLRPLERAYFDIPPQAKECVLAFCRVPSLEEDFGQQAAMALGGMGWGKDLLARMMGVDSAGRMRVVLYAPAAAAAAGGGEGGAEAGAAEGAAADAAAAAIAGSAEAGGNTSINERLVEEGLARLARGAELQTRGKALATEYVSALKAAQEVAHKGRLNMWRYGDCASDDEDDFPRL